MDCCLYRASARARHPDLELTLHFPGQRPTISADSSGKGFSIYCYVIWRHSSNAPVCNGIAKLDARIATLTS